MKKNISALAKKFSTDKNTHGYIDFYQNKLPDNVSKLLEIGAFQGESLFMWQAVFPNAEIHTIENFADSRCMLPADIINMGVVLHEGDQNDVNFLSTIKEEFDVIIDDGDHRPAGQIQAFRHLFANNLKQKGVYFIEDVFSDDEGWNYQVEMKDRLMPAIQSFMDTGNWGSKFFPDYEADFWRNVIKKIEVYDNKLVMIRKK